MMAHKQRKQTSRNKKTTTHVNASTRAGVEEWRTIIDKARGKDGKIRWDALAAMVLAAKRLAHDGTLEQRMAMAQLMLEHPLITPLIDMGLVDLVRIQEVADDEPILSFTTWEEYSKDGRVHGYNVWKGKAAVGDSIDVKITENAIAIPIKLLQDARVAFRTDTAPMKQAIPRLKELGLVPQRQGGDRRSQSQQYWESQVLHACVETLTADDRIPTAHELLDAFFARGVRLDVPDLPNLHRLLGRLIPRAIAVIITERLCRKSPEHLPVTP